MKVVSVVDVFL